MWYSNLGICLSHDMSAFDIENNYSPFFLFFKDCGRTQTQKGPQHGPSTIMRKITIKKNEEEFKRLKNNLKDLKMNKKTVIDN